MSVRIIADSTCDLSQDLIEKYNVTILPLHIVLGNKEYKDGVEIKPDQIYQWADENKTTPKTSAASIEDVMNVFEECKKNEEEVVCFSISGLMSTTVNVMKMAAQEVEMEDQVFVIDSKNLSTGGGLLVVEAAIMAKEGKCAKEIAEYVTILRDKVRASFVVDTLTYLHRGGRCSGVAALAGGALKLHPKIVVENGVMKADKKYRGKMIKVIQNYVEEMKTQLLNAKKDRVFITHSGCEKEILETVYQYLESLNVFDEILMTRAGGVISSHCGPGTLGVLFVEAN